MSYTFWFSFPFLFLVKSLSENKTILSVSPVLKVLKNFSHPRFLGSSWQPYETGIIHVLQMKISRLREVT